MRNKDGGFDLPRGNVLIVMDRTDAAKPDDRRFVLTELRFILLVFVISTTALCQAEPTELSVNNVGDWAIHESSGRVFAAKTDGNSVSEFDHNGKEVRAIQVGQNPRELIIKRDKLIVACTGSQTLHVFDLNSNQVTGKIAIEGRAPYGLFCSQVDNDLVFCIADKSSSRWYGDVFQCNIQSHTVQNQQASTHRSWLHVAMSRDGKWIVPDARGHLSPSSGDLTKVDEDDFTFVQRHDYHKSFGPIAAGPRNRFWTFGKSLYSLDTKRELRTFGGSYAAIHPQLDLVASFEPSGKGVDTLYLEKLSNADRIKAIETKGEVVSRSRRRSEFLEAEPMVGFDLKNNKVFVGTPQKALWVHLADYREQLVPYVAIEAPSELSTQVNRKLRLPVRVSSRPPGSVLKLAESPSDAKIVNNEIQWTPNSQHVGSHKFQIQLVDDQGKVLDAVEMVTEVTLPVVKFDFSPSALQLSPGGRYAIVWGQADLQERRHSTEPGPAEAAVVDLKRLKIVGRKTLPQGVRMATIDVKNVYIVPSSGALFYRMDHQFENKIRQFTSATPSGIEVIGPKRVAVLSNRLQVFDAEKMKEVNPSAHNNNIGMIFGQNSLSSNGDYVFAGGKIFDRQTGDVLKCNVCTLPLIANPTGNMNYVPRPNRGAIVAIWGRTLTAANLQNRNGKTIARIDAGNMGSARSVFSEKWPLLISVSTKSSGRSRTQTVSMRNLIDGNVEHTMSIDRPVPMRSSQSFNRGNTIGATIGARGGHLVYINDKELVRATIPAAVGAKQQVPVHFAYKQTNEVQVQKASTTISLAVIGDRSGAEYGLLSEYPGLEVDPETGALTVDSQRFWDDFKKAVVLGPRSTRPVTLQAPEVNKKNFHAFTGKELAAGKYALQLPVRVSLTGEDGQTDSITINLVFIGDRGEISSEIADRDKKMKAEMDAQMAKSREKSLQRQAAAARAKQLNGDPNKRIADLEQRIRRVEAALDSVLKKLEEMNAEK